MCFYFKLIFIQFMKTTENMYTNSRLKWIENKQWNYLY